MFQEMKLYQHVCHWNNGNNESRLDAEILTLVADEFGFGVEFVTAEIEESIQEEDDSPQLKPRPPIVTVMGMLIMVKLLYWIMLEMKM